MTGIDLKLLVDFEYYLQHIRNCNHNSALKYVKLFKKIVRIAQAEGLIIRDPFMNYRAKFEPVDREYLNDAELKSVEELKFLTGRLELVRDLSHQSQLPVIPRS